MDNTKQKDLSSKEDKRIKSTLLILKDKKINPKQTTLKIAHTQQHKIYPEHDLRCSQIVKLIVDFRISFFLIQICKTAMKNNVECKNLMFKI